MSIPAEKLDPVLVDQHADAVAQFFQTDPIQDPILARLVKAAIASTKELMGMEMWHLIRTSGDRIQSSEEISSFGRVQFCAMLEQAATQDDKVELTPFLEVVHYPFASSLVEGDMVEVKGATPIDLANAFGSERNGKGISAEFELACGFLQEIAQLESFDGWIIRRDCWDPDSKEDAFHAVFNLGEEGALMLHYDQGAIKAMYDRVRALGITGSTKLH